jgi:type IV pilus assembly protein PilA
MRKDEGFSLIEVLVVILLIGVLAALALPAFIGQRSKGEDTDAKSDARNLVSHLEAFHATEKTYAADQAKDSDDIKKSGLSLGGEPGEVDITEGDEDTYTIVATSQSGGTFTVSKDADGAVARTCSEAGDGGCSDDGDW